MLFLLSTNRHSLAASNWGLGAVAEFEVLNFKLSPKVAQAIFLFANI
jgi:hypothetical protein